MQRSLPHFFALCALFWTAACAAPTPSETPTEPRPAREAYPFEAKGAAVWRWETAQTNGVLAPDAYRNALDQREQNQAYWDNLDGGGINPLTWVDRGPDDRGGRCRALLIHPTIPSRWYAGSVGGGIWRSDTSGGAWYPIGDEMPNLAISCMTFDPANANILYAGTGEGVGNFDAIRGAGIWKSTDAGATWAQLASTQNADFDYVTRIAVSPTNSALILASTSRGIWRSTDSGANWTQVSTRFCYQVVWDPNDANKAVAAILRPGSIHEARYSTDAGASWSVATGIVNTDRIELAYAPSVSNRVYATGGAGGVYRSADGGQSWTLRGSFTDRQWWYNNCIWVDPTNSSRVVVGATSVWRSQDGGTTWTECGDTGTTSPHADVHGIVAHPSYNGTTNRQVMLATDGGIYRTFDIVNASSTAGATGWTARNSRLRVAQFYEADGDANLRLAGGLQDNGTVSLEGSVSQASTRYLTGDGFPAYISSANSDYIYGAYQYAQPHRSIDGGLSGASITSGIAATEFGGKNDSNLNPPFRTPLALSESDPDNLFLGSFSVWRCTNAAAATPNWTSIRSELSSTNGRWRVSAIAVSPTTPNIIWVAYWNRTTFRARLSACYTATDPNPIWFDMSMANLPVGRQITRLVVDQNAGANCLVCFGGYASDNLWRTTFFLGQLDEDISGAGVTSLPAAPVFSVAEHPTIPDRLYAATEVGVFASTDDGQTWAPDNGGPLDVACYDIRFANNSETLVLATHGRGIWTSEVVDPQVVSFGAGCAGTYGTPELSATAPRIGLDCVLTTTNCYPTGSVWLVQGGSRTSWSGLTLPLSLSNFGAPACDLAVRPDIVRDGYADGGGVSTSTLPIPALPALLGQSIFLQAWPADVVNSFGRVSSQGLELVIGQ
ncbi:MAG: hypothetical protein ACON4Z_07890 [Planctomycetota bacterium]